MKSIYHRILAVFKRKRRLTPAQMAKKLPPEALAALQREADFLRHHCVSVESLAAGETPGMPKAIDPEVEALLTPPKLEA